MSELQYASESPEIVDIKTGEVTVAKALVPMDGLRAMVKDQDQATFSVVEKLETLNWRDMRPPHMALLLMQKPFPVSGGGSLYLNFRQAIFFATRCY